MSDKRRIMVIPRAIYSASAWKQINKADVDVFMAIAIHINKGSGKAWPAIETIAEMARVDRRTAQRSIKKLVKHRLIELDPSRGKKCHTYSFPNSGELTAVEPDSTAASSPPLDPAQQRRIRPSNSGGSVPPTAASSPPKHGRNTSSYTGWEKTPVVHQVGIQQHKRNFWHRIHRHHRRRPGSFHRSCPAWRGHRSRTPKSPPLAGRPRQPDQEKHQAFP